MRQRHEKGFFQFCCRFDNPFLHIFADFGAADSMISIRRFCVFERPYGILAVK